MQVLTISYAVELLDSYTNTLTQLVEGQNVIRGLLGVFSQFPEKAMTSSPKAPVASRAMGMKCMR